MVKMMNKLSLGYRILALIAVTIALIATLIYGLTNPLTQLVYGMLTLIVVLLYIINQKKHSS
ncbi:hypothetical protein FC83_GL003337 [Agrilactobacillus composti DSM 18527 = JCM 14202]|uniref:Uncharacterized protein n=2 Tax=Agrilactobacillus TaxID=2767875 RepID=A0A0R1XUG9_9LACO|nr:hypothetical protein FC83_GL003337 [Agrilactobacillus composti DSM 18527 = JCM 14202]